MNYERNAHAQPQDARLTSLADSLDCLTEADLVLLANASPNTVESWRKRGTGPSYILLGNRYLYPREALRRYLEGITREQKTARKGSLL